MGEGPRYRVAFRRRREGTTDYRKRLALLKSRKPRLVVRTSNRTVTVQFIEFAEVGDQVRAGATSQELAKHGWSASTSATPAAYLTAVLAASRAKAKGVEEAVLDIGRHEPTPGSRVFAALKGALDAGIEVPHDASVLPKKERLVGTHLKSAPAAQFEKVLNSLRGGAA